MIFQVLLSLPQNSPLHLNSELIKILLKEFHVQGVSVSKQPTLVLYAYDVTTGVVVDIGDRMNIVPIVDGKNFNFVFNFLTLKNLCFECFI